MSNNLTAEIKAELQARMFEYAVEDIENCVHNDCLMYLAIETDESCYSSESDKRNENNQIVITDNPEALILSSIYDINYPDASEVRVVDEDETVTAPYSAIEFAFQFLKLDVVDSILCDDEKFTESDQIELINILKEIATEIRATKNFDEKSFSVRIEAFNARFPHDD